MVEIIVWTPYKSEAGDYRRGSIGMHVQAHLTAGDWETGNREMGGPVEQNSRRLGGQISPRLGYAMDGNGRQKWKGRGQETENKKKRKKKFSIN